MSLVSVVVYTDEKNCERFSLMKNFDSLSRNFGAMLKFMLDFVH